MLKKLKLLVFILFLSFYGFGQSYSAWYSPQKCLQKTLSTNYYILVNSKHETVYAYDGKYCYVEYHKKNQLLWRRVYIVNKSRIMKK